MKHKQKAVITITAWGKPHATIKRELTVTPKTAEAYLKFAEETITKASKKKKNPNPPFLAPNKFKDKNLTFVVPSPGQNPCKLCKYGEETVGPNGCGRAKGCIALTYYQLHQLEKQTSAPAQQALEDFQCAVPNASWLLPQKKKSVSLAGAPLSPPSLNYLETLRTELSKKFDNPKFKSQSSSKPRSLPKRKR